MTLQLFEQYFKTLKHPELLDKSYMYTNGCQHFLVKYSNAF